jgi:hypothetical protein
MPIDLKRKARIRAELFRCAVEGATPITYGQFHERVTGKKMPGRFQWRSYFNAIAMEERSHNYPDITFLVFDKSTKYPGQIEFRRVAKSGPDKKQRAALQSGMKEIRKLYCPSVKKTGHY